MAFLSASRPRTPSSEPPAPPGTKEPAAGPFARPAGVGDPPQWTDAGSVVVRVPVWPRRAVPAVLRAVPCRRADGPHGRTADALAVHRVRGTGRGLSATDLASAHPTGPPPAGPAPALDRADDPQPVARWSVRPDRNGGVRGGLPAGRPAGSRPRTQPVHSPRRGLVLPRAGDA